MKRKKTTFEAIRDLRQAIIEVFLAYCKVFKIDKLIKWLNNLLRKNKNEQ